MPKTGDGDAEPDYAEQIAASSDVHKGAWQRTIDDMQAMAEDLREEGWNVVTIGAGHTAPTNPDAGASDRWGFVHVIPDNEAESFDEAVETGKFPEYRVFRNEMQGRVFVLTELLDPESETAILIAGNFEVRHAPGLVKTALKEDQIYTHVQTLDGTHLGSFRHDDVEKFFPDPHKYAGYQVDFEGVLDDEDEESSADGDSE
jgi:1,2-phenylacetyl-CoA epoxidase PaaB subunit